MGSIEGIRLNNKKLLVYEESQVLKWGKTIQDKCNSEDIDESLFFETESLKKLNEDK